MNLSVSLMAHIGLTVWVIDVYHWWQVLLLWYLLMWVMASKTLVYLATSGFKWFLANCIAVHSHVTIPIPDTFSAVRFCSYIVCHIQYDQPS